MMRLFIAAKLPENILNEIKDIQLDLSRQAKRISLVKKENLHLTLQFIGNASDSQSQLLLDWFNKLKIDNQIKSNCSFSHYSYFKQKKGKLIWAGVEIDPSMSDFIAKIRSDLKSMCFILDDRKWLPHITIARQTIINNLNDILNRLNINKNIFNFVSIDLIKSEFTKFGVQYTSLISR